VTPNIPPFDCKTPDDYLFWDGIHPTRVVHGIFAQEAAALLSQ
jgi:phospholipase/lecithinase/hemolysin